MKSNLVLSQSNNNLFWLWAVLILLGLGILMGLAIFLAEKYLKVKEDKRISEVEKMLPNANCGACGHAGCHEMAESLVSGKELHVEKCVVGKKETTYDPINRYLKEHPNPIYDETDKAK